MKFRIRQLRILPLMICILLTLASCSKVSAQNSLTLGNANAMDTLRICVDIGYNDDYQQKTDLRNFMATLQELGGLENIIVDVIPKSGSERNIVISRIKTEIMSGTGPDVFIIKGKNNDEGSTSLIPYPEKAMDTALFLPLDEYIENNAKYTEWDKQQPTVLAAGKNKEGQQLIPLSYTFPVMIFPQMVLDVEKPDALLTWDDTLHDPKWAELYSNFVDCSVAYKTRQSDGKYQNIYTIKNYLPFIMGQIADFHKEELLFTEDELMQCVSEILERHEATISENKTEDDSFHEHMISEDVSSKIYPSSLTMLPLYSRDGGVTAEIECFAAVNRNTKHPEKAYSVIDILLREDSQTKSGLFVNGICETSSIPLHNNAFHRNSTFHGNFYLTDFSFNELSDIKEQITAANFKGDLTSDLNSLPVMCRSAYKFGSTAEDIVHETYELMQRKLKE